MHWRALSTLDLPAVEAIAGQVHPGFWEDGAIFAEKLRLYPEGCRLLEVGGAAVGYLLSHPWRTGSLPALNTLLEQLPTEPDTFYLHDLAILSQARGIGAAAAAVDGIVIHATAAGFGSLSLVAVNNSVPFWTRHGFAVMDVPLLAGKLHAYEPAARFMQRTCR